MHFGVQKTNPTLLRVQGAESGPCPDWLRSSDFLHRHDIEIKECQVMDVGQEACHVRRKD